MVIGMKKIDWEQLKQKGRRVPRPTYVLMCFLSFYMYYLLYRIYQGLQEPDVHGRGFIYLGMVIIIIISLIMLFVSARALIFKEYAENYPELSENDDEEENEDADTKK